MSYLKIIECCIYVGKVGFVSNAFFGSILVFLTVFCIKRQFGTYKKLLVNFQLIGMVFASLDFLFPTFFHNYNGSLACFSLPSSPSILSKSSQTVILGFYTGIFSATICILAIQFLYRYWAIFDARKLKLFNGFNYFIWITYYVSFGLLWATTVSHFLYPDDYGLRYMSEEFEEKYKTNITDIPILILIPYEENGFKWNSNYGLLIISGISVIQYSIISVCAFKMYRGMKEKLEMMSEQHRRIHRQFFKALLIQTFAPTLFLFFPAFFILSIPYLDLKFSFPSMIFTSGFTVYPAIDSICIMSCVSEYGRCFRKAISPQRKYTENLSVDVSRATATVTRS
ncbi:hypothetical protein CAEBREN_12567 [Caenorhabditis brenneri]|uniref:Seven TM Receptor n=1 Tax=Caenorhabditis brenneri TaxID=135651 RepID=G0NQR1_CAEBE|nr:hypothetical protein CAEBREN_12567 [Caenorhabditis brenneri]